MSSALTPGLAVSSSMRVRRRRELPILGEIVAREGDLVQGDTVVAIAQLEGELRIVRAAEQLGVPAEEILDVAVVREGDSVEAGALIAEVRGLWGLFRSSVTAPLAGRVEFISTSTGHIGIRAPSRPLHLNAYISGTVVAIEANRSVTIESVGTFVQGIFGVGGERQGVLTVLPIPCTHALTEESIPAEAFGRVLVGGHSPTIGALQKASRAGAVGLITGSIDDGTLRDYVGYDIGVALTGDESVTMTVIVTEGFGSIAMSERILDTLRCVEGTPVSINGATQVRAGAQRPEIIGARSQGNEGAVVQSTALEVGSRIRLIRVPYFGLSGTVTEMPQALERIATGAEVRVLRAKLHDGRVVTVPRANVELQ